MSRLRILLFVVTFGIALPAAAQEAADCNRPLDDPMTYMNVPGVTQDFPRHNLGQAVFSRDGCWIFVAVIRPLAAGGNGIEILRRNNGKVRPVRLEKFDGVSKLATTHDGKVLIVGSASRIAFMDIAKLVSGQPNAILGSLADQHFSAFSMVVSSDDRHIFLYHADTAWLTVINLERARASGFQPSSIIAGVPLDNVNTTRGSSIALSPNERYLYITAAAPTAGNWALDCTNTVPGFASGARSQGAVWVYDAERLKAGDKQAAINVAPAGCFALSMTFSRDGETMFASGPQDDAVYTFDIRGEAARKPVLTGKVIVGPAPRPLTLVDNGTKLIVANSNDFFRHPGGGAPIRPGKDSLSIIDTRRIRQGAAAIIGTIPTEAMPTGMVMAPDGRTLMVINQMSLALQFVDLQRALESPAPAQQAAENCNQAAKDPITYSSIGTRPHVSRDGCWIFANSPDGPIVLKRNGGAVELHRKLDIQGQVRGLTHDGKILVLANMEVIFVDVERLIAGEKDVVLGRATDRHFSPRHTIGVVTPDDKYHFLSHNETNWVSVVDLDRVRAGQYADAILGGFPAGGGANLVLSPNGRYLYVASGQPDFGVGMPCTRTGDPLKEREGTLLVVDVQRVQSGPAAAVIAGTRVGCGGDLEMSADGNTLYFSDRGGNALVVFDTTPVQTGSAPVLIARVPVQGSKGVALIDGGKKVVVKSSEGLTVIDTDKIRQGAESILGLIAFPEGNGPTWMVVPTPDRKTLVVEVESRLAIVDLERAPVEPVK